MKTLDIQQRPLDRLDLYVEIPVQRQVIEQVWLDVGQFRHQIQVQVLEQIQVDT